jgi:hypothetical protein
MSREYKTSSSGLIYIIAGASWIFVVFFIFYVAITSAHKPPFWFYGWVLFLTVFIFYLINFASHISITVDKDTVTYKTIHRTKTFKYSDIYKIQKGFSYAGRGYDVFYRDENGVSRRVTFDNNMPGHEELIAHLQKKSDIKMRWEGTLDVSQEKRPVVRVLKKIYNILIVIFIILLTMAYPFMASINRNKEVRLHLSEHSLWP